MFKFFLIINRKKIFVISSEYLRLEGHLAISQIWSGLLLGQSKILKLLSQKKHAGKNITLLYTLILRV